MVRTVLIVIDIVVAAAAMAGGVYAMLGAPRVPKAWLRTTPFRSYFVPGVVLLVVVGGSLAAAAVTLLGDLSGARVVSLEAGIVMLGWMAAQLSMIGYRHWTQGLLVALGIAVVVLSFALPAPG